MRGWSLVAFVGILAVPLAGAHPGSDGSLYLTNTAINAQPEGIGDQTYALGPTAGDKAEISFPLSAGIGYALRFEDDAKETYSFLADGVLSVPVSCKQAGILGSLSIYVYLVNSTYTTFLASGSYSLPTPCQGGQVVEAKVKLPLDFVSIYAGETLQVRITASEPNVPASPNLVLLAGDAARPARLLANWTASDLLRPFYSEQKWTSTGSHSVTRFFSSSADGAVLRVRGNLTGSSAYATVRLTDMVNGYQVFEKTYDVPSGKSALALDDAQLVLAPQGLRWQVYAYGYGDKGDLNVTLTPAVVSVKETVETPVVGGNETTPGPLVPGNLTAGAGGGGNPTGEPVTNDSAAFGLLVAPLLLATAAFTRRLKP